MKAVSVAAECGRVGRRQNNNERPQTVGFGETQRAQNVNTADLGATPFVICSTLKLVKR